MGQISVVQDKMKAIEDFFSKLDIPDFFGSIRVGFQNGKACTLEVNTTKKLRKKKEAK